MYNKQIFFLLSSVVVCMHIVGMEQENQEKGLVTLPKEVICKTTQYCDLQSIGRFKQVCKKFSEYDISNMICPSHGQIDHVCSSIAISEFAKKESYEQYSHILMHCAQRNEKMFESLYLLHEKSNDDFLRRIYDMPYSMLTVNDRIFGYSGRYVNEARVQKVIDQQKNEALFNASGKGHFELVQSLIENGANVNVVLDNHISGFRKATPLLIASSNGHLEVAKLLLDKGAKVDDCNSDGETSLHIACEKGDRALVQLLKERGATINCKALYKAISHGHFDLAQWLIDEGVDVNSCGSDEDTLLCRVYKGDSEDDSEDDSESKDSSILFLLRNRAEINKCGNSNKKAILHHVCEKNDIKTVKVLLENGADVNLITEGYKSKKTPLYIACKCGSLELVQFLIENGANVHTICEEYCNEFYSRCREETCIDFVLRKNYFHKALLLIGAGANIIYTSGHIDTWQKDLLECFSLACHEGNAKVAAIILIKSDLKVDANKFNWLLHQASEKSYVEIVKLLIDQGADYHVYNRTSLSIMEQKPEFKELVDSLSFLDKNPRLIRNTAASLLVLGSLGACYYFYNKIFNS